MSIDPAAIAALFPQVTPSPQGVSVLLIATPPQLPPKVAGEVINIDKSGQVVIQTDEGEIVIKTELALRVGQSVELRLPPPQLNAPPIATLIPSPVPLKADGTPAPQPLPPTVLVDLAVQADLTQNPLPQQIAPVLPGYGAPPVTNPPAQTLFQLIGLELPATVLPQAASQVPTPPASAAPNVGLPPSWASGSGNGLERLAGFPPSAAHPSLSSVPAAPPAIDKVQIMFLGPLDQARELLKNFTPDLSAATMNMNTPLKSQIAQVPMTTAPLLAQLVGLTPQKLPVFEAMPFAGPTVPGQAPMADGESMTFPKPALPTGTQIVVHSPVLMTVAEEKGPAPTAALLVRMPTAPLSPEAAFALDAWPDQAPLMTQMLHDPATILPAAMAAQVNQLVPRPNSPQFAMNLVLSILGLSKGDAAQAVGIKMLKALKPEQRSQLQREIAGLPNIAREGVPQGPEGLRVNFPVEMAGQLYMWQMTVRHPDYDGHQRTGSGPSEKPTRFILDMYMSQMGPMQMDGLSFSKSRRLDLILRTQQPLMERVKNELIVETLSIFDRADLKGSIDFQTL